MATERQQLLSRFLDHETIYLNGLTQLSKLLVTPLEQSLFTDNPLLTRSQFNSTVGSLKPILPATTQFHTTMKEKLRHYNATTTRIGDVFQELAPFWPIYSAYLSNEKDRAYLLHDANSPLGAFVAMVKKNNASFDLELTLTSPGTQFAEYLTFLKRYADLTDKKHPDYVDLKTSIETLEALNSKSAHVHTLQSTAKKADLKVHFSSFMFHGYADEVNMNNQKRSLRRLALAEDVLVVSSAQKGKQMAIKNTISLRNSRFEVLEASELFSFIEEKPCSTYPFVVENRSTFAMNKSTSEHTFQEWVKHIQEVMAKIERPKSFLDRVQQVKEEIFTQRDWKLLLNGAELITFKPGEVIIKQGTYFANLFKIKSGRVHVEKEIGGKKSLLKVLADGDFFGEMSFLDNKTNASVIAASEVVVFQLSKENLRKLLLVDASFSERFAQMICISLANRLHNMPLRMAISSLNKQETKDQVTHTLSSEKAEEVAAKHNKDRVLEDIFQITESDVLVKEFPASVSRKKLKINGTLYVFGKHVGFYAKVFGLVVKFVEAIDAMTELKGEDGRLIVSTGHKIEKFYMEPQQLSEVLNILTAIWKPARAPAPSKSASSVVDPSADSPEKFMPLTSEDWDNVFEYSNCQIFEKDQVVVTQGDHIKRIYHINDGSCRVEKWNGNEREVLGRMNAGEIFGEITFMFGGGAAVSIVADEDTVIYTIERTQVDKLFQIRPDLGGKFYKFLASQIGKRLRKNEQLLDDVQQSEKALEKSHNNDSQALTKSANGEADRVLQIINDVDIRDVYTIGRVLGSGGFSVVHEAQHKKNGQKWAVKVIKKTLTAKEKASLAREIDIMRQVKHPNIILVNEIYETPQQLFLVMEMASGGELFNEIVARGKFSEPDAARTAREIVEGISYLHAKGIVHRDLKPENLLLSSREPNASVKIADFGLSKVLAENLLLTACGTPEYAAPELLLGEGYGSSVDIWAFGVILYILLCGFQPFGAPTTAQLFSQIMAGKYKFISPYWDKISDNAKDLVRNVLVVDPKRRFTAADILRHPFLNGKKK